MSEDGELSENEFIPEPASEINLRHKAEFRFEPKTVEIVEVAETEAEDEEFRKIDRETLERLEKRRKRFNVETSKLDFDAIENLYDEFGGKNCI